MRCLNCHYDLSNLREKRCPECGRGFDPNDSRTFDTLERRALRLKLFRGAVIVGVCAALLFVVRAVKPGDFRFAASVIVLTFAVLMLSIWLWLCLRR